MLMKHPPLNPPYPLPWKTLLAAYAQLLVEQFEEGMGDLSLKVIR